MYIQNNNPKIEIAATMILLVIFAAHATAVTVSVDASESVPPGKQFNVEIEIDQVKGLDSGQFDISFNPNILHVTDITEGIKNGVIGGMEVPILTRYMGEDTIRLLFNFTGVSNVSGSGSLATIVFEAVGNDGDISFLDLSDGLLVDTESSSIDADWIGGMVTIGDGALPPAEYTVAVYVKNIDDDRLDVHLLIDGTNEVFESISSGRAEKCGDYDLVEGGVSGPGYLAKITFDVVGDAGGTSAIDFCESDEFMGKLMDFDGEIIAANWSGADATIVAATSIITE